FLTARDCSQTCGLADMFRLNYRRIGRHYGRLKVLKAWGTVARAMQLYRVTPRQRPVIAVSHGSRSQLLAAAVLGIPSIVICDYEFASALPGVSPTWVMMPDVIPADSVKFRGQVLQYPGIKEDVYVPDFRRDLTLRSVLGLAPETSVV